jgi:putative membrane protein
MTALGWLLPLADGAGRGAHPLVHLNAALNTLATVLLLVGLARVKRGDESAHGKTMLAAFAASTAFLVSYLTYHAIAGSVPFTHPGPIRYVYLVILISHVGLALTVPFLAIAAMLYGSKALGWGRAAALDAAARAQFREKHRRLVRWAFPIWLYVSITGVVVYAMLYHIWPSDRM